MRRLHSSILALILAAAPALAAGPIEENAVIAGKAALDPAMGYIFASPGPVRMMYTFLREPDAEARADYQQDFDKSFAKAQKSYDRDIKSWQDRQDAYKATGIVPGPRPVAPARDTFSIDPIETRGMVSIGPMFVYSKGNDKFTYLTPVKPGTYVYYGPLMAGAGTPPVGNCYCMGTVKFEVKAGVVTDIGNFLNTIPLPSAPYDVVTRTAFEKAKDKAAKTGKAEEAVVPAALAFGQLPDSLKAWPVVRADFHASGKMNNYFGLLVTRIPPIDGVIGYRRDTVIDLRTNSDVPTPSIRTMVRIKK